MDNPLSIQASFALGLPECGLPLVLLTDLCLKLSLSWIGVVIKDHTGSLLDGSAHCFQSSPVVQAQCHAIRSGLELVHVRAFTNVIVETDSKLHSPLSGGHGLLKMRTMQLTGWLCKQEGGSALRLGSFDRQSPWSSYFHMVYLAHRTVRM
ncbi:PREDICTED: PRUPE_4G261300 [Prunus dulcis]|uniref:PREDICTED: PRUPE_4G261300 n=1 Tax=Prunus dulcis TaxID=3755 RepID=A0A5E4GGX9_PRUDU|nr:PREDICTED: PRUPE_4G261300 [Prunus dulcis]